MRGEIMYCPSCGMEIDDNSRFCSTCGEKITDVLNDLGIEKVDGIVLDLGVSSFHKRSSSS